MPDVLEPKHGSTFQVDCTASPVGSFRAGADSVSVTIGQRIRRLGREEMWDCVAIHCKEEDGGELTVRVLLCNPDLDWPVQVACIRSQPRIDSPAPIVESLQFNLEHIRG